jgi:putative flavoprotein involved in K+ transport
MTTQHIETLIIGAGQAGLATGHELQLRGRDVLILDGVDRIGDSWRRHWDSLRLFTPGRYNSLPGLPFPGETWHYPGRDEVAAYLETYAVVHDLAVRLRTRVERLEAGPGGGFTAHLGVETITCENVVVATGGNGRVPRIPDFAGQLDSEIRQLHSSDYQRPDQLPTAPTLVVGAANSGCEIAHELAADRPVTLCGRDPGHEPFRPGSQADRAFVPVFAFLARHVLTRRIPVGRRMQRHFRRHGIPVGRIRPKDLLRRGVTRLEARAVGVQEGQPVLADGTVLDVAAVVWCTGSAPDFGWIDLPILGQDGWPREYRGVAEEVPGLYFCGLLFQYAVASSVLPGVGRDAAYVAMQIDARTRTADPSPSERKEQPHDHLRAARAGDHRAVRAARSRASGDRGPRRRLRPTALTNPAAGRAQPRISAATGMSSSLAIASI